MSNPAYVRDKRSHAILNTDDREYQNIKVLRERNKKINRLQAEVDNIHSELAQIKELLKNR